MAKVNRDMGIAIINNNKKNLLCLFKTQNYVNNMSAYLTCPTPSFSQSTEMNWLLTLCQALRTQSDMGAPALREGSHTQ